MLDFWTWTCIFSDSHGTSLQTELPLPHQDLQTVSAIFIFLNLCCLFAWPPCLPICLIIHHGRRAMTISVFTIYYFSRPPCHDYLSSIGNQSTWLNVGDMFFFYFINPTLGKFNSVRGSVRCSRAMPRRWTGTSPATSSHSVIYLFNPPSSLCFTLILSIYLVWQISIIFIFYKSV